MQLTNSEIKAQKVFDREQRSRGPRNYFVQGEKFCSKAMKTFDKDSLGSTEVHKGSLWSLGDHKDHLRIIRDH